MNEKELDALLREHGWSLRVRLRRKGTPYLYAQKRQGTRIIDCYLAPASKLGQITNVLVQERLSQKLTKVGPKTETATKHHTLCKSHCLVA